jgi:hypothetical protein
MIKLDREKLFLIVVYNTKIGKLWKIEKIISR